MTKIPGPARLISRPSRRPCGAPVGGSAEIAPGRGAARADARSGHGRGGRDAAPGERVPAGRGATRIEAAGRGHDLLEAADRQVV
jgi:hypothetical protein